MSDSHGDVEMVRRALARFDEEGVDRIIHCGDVGGIEVFELMAGRDLAFVWGNCDEPDAALDAFLNTVGLARPALAPLHLELAGKTFAVFHGHERGFPVAVHRPSTDYLLHGHTHVCRDERRGRCRIINPGALHRARIRTAAVLDPAADDLQFITLT